LHRRCAHGCGRGELHTHRHDRRGRGHDHAAYADIRRRDGADEDLSTPMLSRVDGAESIGSSSCDPFPSGATSPREKDCSGASSSSSSIK
ncbi:hypothetical protein, partial [Porphyromonas endodontalis]|uniref:hypothetical protein n=1 Tax=Porphyromonas endodontalis TaxID=28124 RepID=UPI0036168B32